jgi:electron transport complex protein RnfC
MLITELKAKEAILPLITGKVFILNCHGCKEIRFPEAEAKELEAELVATGNVTGVLTTDYICNPENLKLRFEKHQAEIDAADTVLVLSCGVGVQTVASALENKKVIAACDTIALPGFQGVTPLEHDCHRCGQCYLNLTGGICPITACSKSLLNGQCGGAKNGKCEVDPNMDCGWERIHRKLEKLGHLDLMKCPVQLRDWSVEETAE